MQYITGLHALHCPCSLQTPGKPYHGVDWTYPATADTDNTFFKDYGIEVNESVPAHGPSTLIANHLRACLDLLSEGKTQPLVGLKREIIANNQYTAELFDKVITLKEMPIWNEVSWFMGCEYGLQWLDFLKTQSVDWPVKPNSHFEPIAPEDNTLLAFVQAKIKEFQSYQKISSLAGLFHSVLFRQSEINRVVKIELRAFLSKLYPERLWFLKTIDHYPSDPVLEKDFAQILEMLNMSEKMSPLFEETSPETA